MKISRYFALGLVLLFSVFPIRAADEPAALLKAYTQVGKALASDDLKAAKDGAEKLAAATGASHAAHEQAANVAQSESLAQARERFKALSQTAIAWAEKTDGFHVMTCPMAKADWVQEDPQVANPYYGKTMLRCGGLKR